MLVSILVSARELFRAQLTLCDLHRTAVVLNPRTRILKLAIDVERGRPHTLVRSEMTQTREMTQSDDSRLAQPPAIASHSQSSYKKFVS